jgi:hypothetical protein
MFCVCGCVQEKNKKCVCVNVEKFFLRRNVGLGGPCFYCINHCLLDICTGGCRTHTLAKKKKNQMGFELFFGALRRLRARSRKAANCTVANIELGPPALDNSGAAPRLHLFGYKFRNRTTWHTHRT